MKHNNKMFEERYNKIMNEVSRSVRTILERLNEEDLEECFEDDNLEECGDMYEDEDSLYEMGRRAVRSTINPKYKANVRDAFGRRNYDEAWAKSVKPLAKFGQDELLQRYVYSLVLMNKECPQTEEEIDEIGIFANYAHKFLEDGGTLEEIIDLYNEQDKVTTQKRVGSARPVKSYRKPAAQEEPQENFDFDREETADIDEEPVEQDEEIVNVDDYPEIEDDDDLNLDEYPELDVDSEDEEENEFPAYDEVDVEEDEVLVDEDEPKNEVIIENIDDLTEEDYFKPDMNEAFQEFDDDVIKVKNGKIGVEIKIIVEDENDEAILEIWGDSMGEILSKVSAAIKASFFLDEKFVEIRIKPIIKWLRNCFTNTLSNDIEIEQMSDKMYAQCFEGADNCQAIADAIAQF